MFALLRAFFVPYLPLAEIHFARLPFLCMCLCACVCTFLCIFAGVLLVIHPGYAYMHAISVALRLFAHAHAA